ncbi:TetR/AcrR family transcriptional regulator [Konateibacter massiliensis]|uniref:TetR/AcrR family transcriptional regulator n=1 Tax=Konateibacter massiliensis TaxID=2002841 RepID=UPI000C146BE4|nr:TetR/AcrR family transcriptional regulator [Konateibacter massiliensis]
MDTRETILEEALDLFYTKGYDSVGVQEIAENAGITKPTLYYYFGSKTGLLKEILESYGGEFIREMKAQSRYEGDLPGTLYRTAAAYVELAKKHRKFYFFMLALTYYAKENEAHKAVKPFIAQLNRIVLEIFENAAPLLGNMNGRQQKFAMGFVGTINGYILYVSETSEDGELNITNEQVFTLVHQFMHGIYS